MVGIGPTAQGLDVADPPDGAWSRPPAFGDARRGWCRRPTTCSPSPACCCAPVLSGASVRAMTTGRLTPEQRSYGGLLPDFFTGNSWGYGVSVADSGAYGWDGGFGTSWIADPRHDLTVLVLTQRLFDSPGLPQVHSDFRAAAYEAIA